MQSYQDIVRKRRELKIGGYLSFADVGFDGDWVSPYQISSRSPDGPVLLAYNWCDAETFLQRRKEVEPGGYLPGMKFNVVLERALKIAAITRADIYVTQVFHLLARSRSEAIPQRALDESFKEVTRHELEGRRVIALGSAAAQACRSHDIDCEKAQHPSARRGTYEERAAALAGLLKLAQSRTIRAAICR